MAENIMHRFPNTDALILHAYGFVEQAVNRLETDVKKCLKNGLKQPALFPAILYCFSTINLLGALTIGQANKRADNTGISIHYMTCFMHYSPDNAELLIDLFRHKLVHLAQPSPVIKRGSKWIIWKLDHHDSELHLKTLPCSPDLEIDGIPSEWHIKASHVFHLNVMDFATHIRHSAIDPNGYLNLLEKYPYLQVNYVTAINQIYYEDLDNDS